MATTKKRSTKSKPATKGRTAGTGKTKTAGAVKGGNGKYHFRMDKLKKVPAGTGYSTSHGGVVEVHGAHHWLFVSNADEVARAIRRFLAVP